MSSSSSSTPIQSVETVTSTSAGGGTTSSSSLAPVESINENTTNDGAGPSSSGGLPSSAKIGIGVAVPLAVIAIAILIVLYRRRSRNSRQANESHIQEQDDGGLPEHIPTIVQIKNDPSQYPQGPDDYGQKGLGDIVSVHELDQHPAAGTPGGNFHEFDNHNPASIRHELNADARSPVNLPIQPTSTNLDGGALAVPTSSTFASPWETGERYTSTQPAEFPISTEQPASGATRFPDSAPTKEDEELRQLENEMAQIRERKERLQQLQALESREEELRRTIEERRLQKGRV